MHKQQNFAIYHYNVADIEFIIGLNGWSEDFLQENSYMASEADQAYSAWLGSKGSFPLCLKFCSTKICSYIFWGCKETERSHYASKNPIGIMLKLTPREKPPKMWPIQKHIGNWQPPPPNYVVYSVNAHSNILWSCKL